MIKYYKTPSFSYMGGKARLRSWLVKHFPNQGRFYLEPFAGLGNVFYLARNRLDFSHWQLNDIDVSFFTALMSANLDELPDSVSKEDFYYWKSQDDSISKLIKPRITFAGKGYQAGYNGKSGTHTAYNGKLYGVICTEARRLLGDAFITEFSWDKLGISSLLEDDFVYCDPPYIDTKACYPNIDHIALVDILNQAKCRWALSGYVNSLYDNELKFRNRYIKERNSEIKSSNSGKYEGVREILWTNY